jgi:putative endonuclease
MGDRRHELGIRAERAVERWLVTGGWEILERRWRGPAGELDLVCRDPGRVLVAVEVKARTTGRAGSGAQGLSHRQIGRLRVGIGHYAATHPLGGRGVRVDLVEAVRETADLWRLRRIPGLGGW